MATIVGVRANGGVVLGGDERTVEGSVVTGRAERVWDGGEVGAAAVGAPGDVDEFVRTLSAELQRQRAEGTSLTIARVATVAGDLAREAGVDAVVAARDDGVAGIREVLSDGSVLETEATARGTGMEVAVGVLESRGETDFEGGDEPEDSSARRTRPANAADLVIEALDAAAERDAGTGDGIDLFRLADGA